MPRRSAAGRKGRRPGRQAGPRSRAQGSITGAVTTKAELGLQVVDFFDYVYGAPGSVNEGNVKHYYWNVNQNLFNNNLTGTNGQENSFCRIRKFEVYALPARNLTSPALGKNSDEMYTCNVQTPSLAGYTRPGSAVSNSIALGTNVQVTNILPQIDTFWKKVFACDMQKTFQSGVIRPFYVENNQCLFSLRLLDPTTGTDFGGTGSENITIKIKVVLHLDQPIMPVQKARKYILSNFDVGSPDIAAAGGTLPSEPDEEYVQMDLKSVKHSMR